MIDSKKVISLIDSLKFKGATYADIRVHAEDDSMHLSYVDGALTGFSTHKKRGYGIRVLANGAWGFASSEDFKSIEKVAAIALERALTASTFITNKVELMPKEIKKNFTFNRPCEIDPFKLKLNEIVDRVREIDQIIQDPKIFYRTISALIEKKKILFFDSEGSQMEKSYVDVFPYINMTAKDIDGVPQTRGNDRSSLDRMNSMGFETILNKNFDIECRRLKEELLEVSTAKSCTEEVCDVILLNSMMALQTHETIGHALELDRILGYELSYAGGSHVDLQHFNNLTFGSSKLTARANSTISLSVGSPGFDDDGVVGQNAILIEKGLLKGAICSRQSAAEANKKFGKQIFNGSAGAARAESYNRLPIDRMTNINVDYGTDGNLENIIKNTENGLILESAKSWSIGSNRENFHFATEVAWKVINGKKAHMVRNATYRGDSIPFWKSLDMVGDESTWSMQQLANCGKGEPNQIMRVGHGVPVCRFKNVQVGR